MNAVDTQYRTQAHLRTRMSIHEKYSTNQEPFADWIAAHYQFPPGARILELGCGTGQMWQTHFPLLSGCHLTLTDFSAGMLESARKNLSGWENLDFQIVDIQNIPYPAASFDAVIANMMLYHVPDLDLGLAEVRRILKPGGTFYCATFGENGIHRYTTELLNAWGVSGHFAEGFTLQNGAAALVRHFGTVTRFDREDSLAITDIRDFADYIYSMTALTNVDSVPRADLLEVLEARMENSVLSIPKEYGMFVCR